MDYNGPINQTIRHEQLLGQILIKNGLITSEQLSKALEEQKITHERFGSILLRQGVITEEELGKALSEQFCVPYMPLDKVDFDLEVVKLIPETIIKKYLVLPLKIIDNKLILAMEDPYNIRVMEELKLKIGMTIEPVIASPSEIQNTINLIFEAKQDAQKVIEEISKKTYTSSTTAISESITPLVEETPATKFVNSLLIDAINKKVSDIHIEPQEDMLVIRYRIDGVLHKTMEAPKHIETFIISCLKVKANINIIEHRRPQEGRFTITHSQLSYDFRVSTMPVFTGEKMVLRILRPLDVMIGLENLGLFDDDLERLKCMTMNPYGIIITSGPTGSGKTTTLYTLLQTFPITKQNIVTIEDPVEYPLKWINQVSIAPHIGLTYAEALRSILRQDPDIIMIGEIRDSETLNIAVEAALTGHLFLSTIHGNDAVSTIYRLIEMKVQPSMLATTLIGIIAQRLVRCICIKCKEEYVASSEELKFLKIENNNKLILDRGRGCKHCIGTGYKGRVGLFEILFFTPQISDLIYANASILKIKKTAIDEGMHPLIQDGRRKILQRITTVEEVMRVIGKN